MEDKIVRDYMGTREIVAYPMNGGSIVFDDAHEHWVYRECSTPQGNLMFWHAVNDDERVPAVRMNRIQARAVAAAWVDEAEEGPDGRLVLGIRW